MHKIGTRRAMDRTIDSTAAEEAGIGGVDDGIYL